MIALQSITSQQYLDTLEIMLESVELTEDSYERIAVFEDIILDAFVHLVIGERIPALVGYFDTVLVRYPQIRMQIKNQLGQFGIKALAGVPVVMLKEIDSDIVKASLPGVIPMLLHHLLEVVSDKIESTTLSRFFNIPPNFAVDFAKVAYELMGRHTFYDVQDRAIDYLQKLNIREIDLTQLDQQFKSLFSEDNIRYLIAEREPTTHDIDHISLIAQNPVKYLLLLNLLVIENASHNLYHAYIRDADGNIIETDQAVLFDFALQALCARYFSVAVTEDFGYAQMDLKHAVETRADSILTNYTFAAVISAVAAADDEFRQQVEAEQFEIQETIHLATSLIGMANDCGFRLLRMSDAEIEHEIDKLRQIERCPRPTDKDNPIDHLHAQAKEGMLESRYLALFPIIKDIAKGERNLALDCLFNDSLHGWDRVLDNVIVLSHKFQETEAAFYEAIQSLRFQTVARMLDNFVQYNYQIYDLGADYDHKIPVIEQLAILKK